MTASKTPARPPRQGSKHALEHVIHCYGDLLFDLCESILGGAPDAQEAFRAIMSEIRRRQAAEPFSDFQRAWVLRIACERLRELAGRQGRPLSPSEQIELDSAPSPSQRLKNFDPYFRRLPSEDRLLLLLKDKYGVPLPEIASAMDTPEGSLKVRRQQALRTLEDWIWEGA